MKKFFVTSFVIFLILFTALIKNSTKRMDDEIFAVKENLRILEKEHEDLKFEFTYLSSGSRLMSFKSKYFENDLNIKKKNELKIIRNENEDILIKKLEIIKSEQ